MYKWITNIKKNLYKWKKKEERKNARNKRSINGEEVIFIFEKVLEGWKTIRIYNTIIQNNPNSAVDKKKTESVATGNCKVYPSELPSERFEYYKCLREKVYKFHIPVLENPFLEKVEQNIIP